MKVKYNINEDSYLKMNKMKEKNMRECKLIKINKIINNEYSLSFH